MTIVYKFVFSNRHLAFFILCVLSTQQLGVIYSYIISRQRLLTHFAYLIVLNTCLSWTLDKYNKHALDWVIPENFHTLPQAA